MRTPCASILVIALALAACGGSGTPPVATPATTPAPSEAIARIGDVTIRANVIQTSALAPSTASGYRIARDDRRVLLLVAVRQGTDAEATALPARVVASVTDLRGGRHDIAMRELRSGGLLDYVGTVDIDLPDTLRFDVVVTREGGATSNLQFTREFYPR